MLQETVKLLQHKMVSISDTRYKQHAVIAVVGIVVNIHNLLSEVYGRPAVDMSTVGR